MKKMNGLFTVAFILGLVALAAALGAIVLNYLLKKTETAVVVGAFGALCAFVGIIFAYKSKPKKEKQKIIDTDSAL